MMSNNIEQRWAMRATKRMISFRLLVRIMSFLRMTRSAAAASPKEVWILRHGQATHNPRAEAARAAGCSFDEFFDLMRQDDSLDSPLTELGHKQAADVHERYGRLIIPQLVVSSPLTRALQTAEGVLPPSTAVTANRLCYEGFREINGVLKNAQRRSVTELRHRFPAWDFDSLSSPEDATWNADALELPLCCMERGFQGLKWMYHDRPETRILLVTHGGILRYTFEDHPQVVMHDGRTESSARSVRARFDNCELRRYHVTWDAGDDRIVLTEVDLDDQHNQDAAAAAAQLVDVNVATES
jgi:broad specificity phosphatase PhoE